MKIINRYIFKEATTYFLICLIAFTGILLVLRMLKLSSLIINKGVELSQVVMVFLSIIPTFLEIAVPLSALLGVMLAFARFSGDSEIIVIRASGISLFQLIMPVALFGLLATILCLFISTELKPWGYRKLESTLFEIARNKSTAGLTAGIFNDLGNITLYADAIDHATGRLENVLIDDRRGDESQIIIAHHGQILSNSVKKTIVFRLYDGRIHELSDGKYVITDFENNDLETDPEQLFSNQNESSRKRSRELSSTAIQTEMALRLRLTADDFLSEEEKKDPLAVARASTLSSSIELNETFQDNQKRINRLAIELYQRWSLPVASLILALIAMPLGIQPPRTQRTWGAGLSAAIGLLVFVVYFALLSVSIALAESGTIAPFIAVWIPNAVTSVVALYMLRKMSSEQWQSVAQGLDTILAIFTRKAVNA